MELQKLLKKTVAFRFNKRNNRETDPESVNYTNEIQLLSPSKSNFSHSELGIIPFNLGKSEKFENKQQITNALKGLNMIKEFSKESYFRSKTKIQKRFWNYKKRNETITTELWKEKHPIKRNQWSFNRWLRTIRLRS